MNKMIEKKRSCNKCTHINVCKWIDMARKDSMFQVAFGLPENLAKICYIYFVIGKD